MRRKGNGFVGIDLSTKQGKRRRLRRRSASGTKLGLAAANLVSRAPALSPRCQAEIFQRSDRSELAAVPLARERYEDRGNRLASFLERPEAARWRRPRSLA